LSVMCFRQKLYNANCKAIAVRMLTHFLENAFVRRVSLRMHIRIVEFCRSTCDGQILEPSRSP
jgi:hypothetical protein